jgi:hypothetical protein
VDDAHVLNDLSDTHFPKAKKIVLVQDNLNTHKPTSLYEAFPAPEARRLVEKFEWHREGAVVPLGTSGPTHDCAPRSRRATLCA